MKFTHIYHSGVLTETKECYYLFDYFQGPLPALQTEKPILVFVSHSHQDHYNPKIFELLNELCMRQIYAVLPNDIKARRYPAGYTLLQPDTPAAVLDPAAVHTPEALHTPTTLHDPAAIYNRDAAPAPFTRAIIKVYHSKEYDLPCRTHIRTLLSTDVGVAFLLTCPEGVIYHAGDLNDWVFDDMPETERRQMTGSFQACLRPLKGIGIDIACLPLDPRLNSHYADGFLYFLRHYSAKKVCPIHYWDRPDIISQFTKEHPEYADIIIRKE